ncbi:MAG: hypothetical protein MJ252_00445 [archaeon]|nr:hypothetical protein [archaeon]
MKERNLFEIKANLMTDLNKLDLGRYTLLSYIYLNLKTKFNFNIFIC